MENQQNPAPNGAPAEEKKLSNAEIKKRKQAEKAARREREKAERGATAGPSEARGPPAGASTGSKKPDDKPQQPQLQRRPSAGSGGGRQNLPTRGKPAQPTPPSLMTVKKEKEKQARAKAKAKEVGLFGHLYGQPRRYTVEGAPKEVHPAVLATGLQMSSYQICGSNARCVAMLLSFKKVYILLATLADRK
jgi:translation initiation factor eIF-2B subunit delta